MTLFLHHKSERRLLNGLAVAVLVAAVTSGVTASEPQRSDVSTAASSPPGAVTVSGNHILRDGVPWTPHAVQLVAFVAPPSRRTGAFIGYRHYSPTEFAAIRAWGADSVLLQLSQPGADPGEPGGYDGGFVDTYIKAVRAARAAGLNVIVSIQDELQSGEEAPADLPNTATNRVWRALLPRQNGDPAILYEMFNEPQVHPAPEGWARWAAAMNAVIATIRASGATNTLVADGVIFAETLDGLFQLRDRQVVYSSHPYFHNRINQTTEAWTRKFGALADRFPVIVGEWTSATTYYCQPDTPAAATAFLRYLEARRIGLVAVANDFGLPKYGGIVSDYRGRRPRSRTTRSAEMLGLGPAR